MTLPHRIVQFYDKGGSDVMRGCTKPLAGSGAPPSLIWSDMTLAIRIHSLSEARIALTEARGLGQAVTLVSARGAAGHAGAGWWRALVAAARAEYPDVPMTAILDCDDSAGDALACLREGIERICFRGRADVAARLRQIGAQCGTEIDHELPDGLDLRPLRDKAAACRVWLRAEELRNG